MTHETNYKETIQQGFIFINEWIDNQTIELKQSDEFKELLTIKNEIEQEQIYSIETYENIRYVLRSLDEFLPFKIKKCFNISTMDYYTMFIASRWFDSIDDHINLIIGVKRFNRDV